MVTCLWWKHLLQTENILTLLVMTLSKLTLRTTRTSLPGQIGHLRWLFCCFRSWGNYAFQVHNLVTDHIPKFDLILCRQIMMHMTIPDAFKVMWNIYISGSTYLLATNFPETMVWYAEKVFILKQINFSLTLNLMKMIMKDIAQSTFTLILSTSPHQSANTWGC